MAATKKLLVLDLGMQSLRLAEFSALSKRGLQMTRAARRDLILDPALEATRPDEIKLALKEILKEWKLQTGAVHLILPAHTVFTKVAPLDVPEGAGDQIEAIISFEAQHNIPFPLEEVVWDYVVMGQTATGAVNVVFIAVKLDLLEELCRTINSTGLQITAVSTALLSLYDAFRHAYPEEAASSTSLVLDIGSRTSNLVITSPTSFFGRSIPSGGLAVTTAICKDMHLGLEEAEQLKIAHGTVGLGAGFAPPEDPVEANLARLARQTLMKTQANISQTISFYRSNLGGSDPSIMLVTGGMASMPYLAEFLAEKFLKETSFFEPLRGVSLSKSAAAFVEENPNNLGELVGGALSLIHAPQTEVDLLPPSLVTRKELAQRLPWLTAAAALILITLASWYGYALYATSLTRAQTAALSTTVDDESQLSSQIEALNSKLTATQKTASDLLAAIQFRNAYPSILEELNAEIPSRFLWITEIQPISDAPMKGGPGPLGGPGGVPGFAGSPGQFSRLSDGSIKAISVKGLYLDNPRQAAVIDDFVTALQSSTIFAVEEKQKSKIIAQRGSPNDQFWAYPFALVIPLHNPIAPLP